MEESEYSGTLVDLHKTEELLKDRERRKRGISKQTFFGIKRSIENANRTAVRLTEKGDLSLALEILYQTESVVNLFIVTFTALLDQDKVSHFSSDERSQSSQYSITTSIAQNPTSPLIRLQAITLNNLGTIHLQKHNYESAFDYFVNTMQAQMSSGYSSLHIAATCINLSLILNKMKKYKEALKHAGESKERLERWISDNEIQMIKGVPFSQSRKERVKTAKHHLILACESCGLQSIELGKKEDACQYYKKSLEFAKHLMVPTDPKLLELEAKYKSLMTMSSTLKELKKTEKPPINKRWKERKERGGDARNELEERIIQINENHIEEKDVLNKGYAHLKGVKHKIILVDISKVKLKIFAFNKANPTHPKYIIIPYLLFEKYFQCKSPVKPENFHSKRVAEWVFKNVFLNENEELEIKELKY